MYHLLQPENGIRMQCRKKQSWNDAEMSDTRGLLRKRCYTFLVNMPTISYMKILIYDVQYRLQAAMYTKYCQERYHGVGTPNAPIVVADTHSTHYSLSWPNCICLSLFLAACSVWGVIWKGNVFWKGQIVPLMDRGENGNAEIRWQIRSLALLQLLQYYSM